MTLQLMTQTQFARHRGVGKSAVSNWKRDGLLVLAEDAQGRLQVDVARTDARLNAKLDPMRGRPATGGTVGPTITAGAGDAPALPLEAAPAPGPVAAAAAGGAIADERIQHLREQRLGQAMKNAQAAGDLVPLIEAERRVAEVGRAARERMQSWLRGVAERFAAESDVRQIMTLGEAGIDQVFAELADAADRGDFAGDDDGADELTEADQAELEAAGDE